MKKAWLIYVFCFMVSVSAIAQRNAMRQGTRHLSNHNYVDAASQYKKAFSQTTDTRSKRELAFEIATAYHRMNRFEDAIQWYADAIGEETNKIHWLLPFADAFQRAGKTTEAEAIVNKALEMNPGSKEALFMVGNLQRLNNEKQVLQQNVVEIAGVNTPFSDYAPAFYEGQLVFSSTRKPAASAKTDARSAEGFSSLYVADKHADGTYLQPQKFPIRNNANTGAFAYDERHNRAFWTQCNNRLNRCMIMTAKYETTSASWTKPQKASFVNKKNHYGHPSIDLEGKWLYFVSDLPGGYGGKDIYRISLKPDGSFGLPINLGQPVNTEKDELFPFIAGDSLLFFASTGHPGYGGLDIFYSFNRSKGFNKVAALPFPFNSYADDFALVMRPLQKSGAFTSSRNRSSGDDIYFFDGYPIRNLITGKVIIEENSQAVADARVVASGGKEEFVTNTTADGGYVLSVPAYLSGKIVAGKDGYYAETKTFDGVTEADENGIMRKDFQFNLMSHPVTISGKVTDRETKKAIANEVIQLVGPAGFTAAVRTNEQGIYAFDSLKPDNVYTVHVSKTGYFAESRLCRIPEVKKAAVFCKATGYDMDFALLRIQEKQEIVIANIYYDLDKASLRETSKIELSKLASMLRETPQVKVQISAHTDTRGSDAHNDKLSDARAKSVVDYLVASGINRNRLISKGYGKRYPLIHHARNEAEHQANRRTTFQVISMDNTSQETASSEPVAANSAPALVFHVQFLVSSTLRKPDEYFSALKNNIAGIVFYVQEQTGVYRYEAGDRFSIEEADALRNQVSAAGFPDCFVVPYLNGKRISMQEAKQWKQ